MNIFFENTASFITAKKGHQIVIRCNVQYTDIGNTEPLDDFVDRHGGADQTASYLENCYSTQGANK